MGGNKYSHLKKGSPEAKAWGREMARIRKLKAEQRKDREKVKSLEDEGKPHISKKRSTSTRRRKEMARTKTVYRYRKKKWLTERRIKDAGMVVLGVIGGLILGGKL